MKRVGCLVNGYFIFNITMMYRCTIIFHFDRATTQNIFFYLHLSIRFVFSATLARMFTRQRKSSASSRPPQVSSQIKFSVPTQKKEEDRFMAWYERHERALTGFLYGTFMLLILVAVIYLCILMVYQYNSVPQKYYRWLGVTYNTSISGCKRAYEKLLIK